MRARETSRPITVMTAINAAASVLAVASSMIVAYFFGASRLVEIYFAATVLSALAFRVTNLGQMAEVLIPIYRRLRHDEGIDVAQRAYAAVLNWMLLGIAAVSVVFFVAAPVIIRAYVPGFHEADWALGVRMFRFILPLVVGQVLLAMLETYCHAEKWFGIPEGLSLAGRAARVAAIWPLVGVIGVWALVVAQWIEISLQIVAFLVILPRRGYRHTLVLRQRGVSMRNVFGQVLSTFSFTGATYLYRFAFDAALSFLPQGTYAVYRYVYQLFERSNGVVMRPVAVVFDTHLSEALAVANERVQGIIRVALSRFLSVEAVVLVAVATAALPGVAFLYGERLGTSNLLLAARLLVVMYALQLLGSASMVWKKTATAVGMVHAQYWATSAVEVVAAGVAWALMHVFGVTGVFLAEAFTVLALAGARLGLLLLRRRGLALFYDLGGLWRWTLAFASGAAIGWAARLALPVGWGAPRVESFVAAAVPATAAATAALGVAYLLGVAEVREGVRLVRAVMARRHRPLEGEAAG